MVCHQSVKKKKKKKNDTERIPALGAATSKKRAPMINLTINGQNIPTVTTETNQTQLCVIFNK